MNSLQQYFSQVPILGSLSDEAQRNLERSAEQRQYRRRQVVHFPDQAADFIFLLCEGRVKLSRVSEQGREITLYLLEGTGLFGEIGLLSDKITYELMAETAQDSKIAVFRRADLIDAMTQCEISTLEVARLIGQRRSVIESSIADLIFLEVPKRIAKLLLRMLDSQGAKGQKGGILLKSKFTHQELANMIGSTRETTTLILNDFKRQGMIDFNGRRVVIKDVELLHAMVRNGNPN